MRYPRTGRNPLVDGTRCMVCIAKQNLFTANRLGLFVAFARDQDNVVGPRAAHRLRDGQGTVRLANHPVALGLGNARLNLIKNSFGRFVTWIVGGDHHAISVLHCNAAHRWPLGRIAITATPKNTDQLPAALAHQRPQRLEHTLKCIGRVGVIHAGPGAL